jgi:hypothetical protein
MPGCDRYAYVDRLAQRGLAIHSYDGTVLTLFYDAQVDQTATAPREVLEDELISFCAIALLDHPHAIDMFPGLRSIVLIREG